MDYPKEINKLPDIKSYIDSRKSLPPQLTKNSKDPIPFPATEDLQEEIDNNLNNAFCEEVPIPDLALQQKRNSTVRHEDVWVERVLEREKKYKIEEAKLAHDRLRKIEKKTHYQEREILSPTSRAKIEGLTARSPARKEIISIVDEEKCKTKRLFPRSLSKKDKNLLVLRVSGRSPLHIPNLTPIKGKIY